MMWCSFFYLLIVFMSVTGITCRRHTVHWDPNLIPTLKDELKIEVQINDWMDVLCPRLSGSDRFKPASSTLILDLYNVSAKHYRNCDIAGQQRLLQCKDPGQEVKLTTKFQRKSPSPIGFVFQPGRIYYYISKPTFSRPYGCSSDTMRMSITVKEKVSESSFRYHTHKVSSSREKTIISSSRHNEIPKINLPTPSSVKSDPRNSAANISIRSVDLLLPLIVVQFFIHHYFVDKEL